MDFKKEIESNKTNIKLLNKKVQENQNKIGEDIALLEQKININILDIKTINKTLNVVLNLLKGQYDSQNNIKVNPKKQYNTENNIATTTTKKQPKLTQAERVILENVPKVYKWIARDEKYSALYLYKGRPYKWGGKLGDKWSCSITNYYLDFNAFNHLFSMVKWKDEEPTLIEDLLKE